MIDISQLLVFDPVVEKKGSWKAFYRRVVRRGRCVELLIAFLTKKDALSRAAVVDEMFPNPTDSSADRRAFHKELAKLAAGEEAVWVNLFEALLTNDEASSVYEHLKPFSPFTDREIVVIRDRRMRPQGYRGLEVFGDCQALLDRIESDKGWENEWLGKSRFLILPKARRRQSARRRRLHP